MDTEIASAAVYVPKGGVGKTSSAAHIGVAAAQEHDLDVVLVDLAGMQNDLATHFGLGDDVEADVDAPISAVFGDQWDLIRESIDDVVDRMTFATDEGPDLIPADPGLSGADNNLASRPLEERYRILEAFVDEELAPRYDLVLFDLPGKEDNIALNGLRAAGNVVATLRPGQFERAQLRNLEGDLEELRVEWSGADDLEELKQLPEEDVVDLELAMVVPTMIRRSINQHTEFVDEIQEAYPEISTAPIRDSANVGQAQEDGRTLFSAPDLYETGEAAARAYREATEQLLEEVQHGE